MKQLAFFCVLFALLRGSAQAQECTSCGAGASRIYLENGAYKGVLVAISSTVKENQTIIQNIQDYFRDGARALHTATNYKPGMARTFGEITILIPSNWANNGYEKPSSEVFKDASFLIQPDEPVWLFNPHTDQIDGQCGKPGVAVNLPESFMLDRTQALKFGSDVGKTLVHEWAHVRYGLFDESTMEDGSIYVPCNSGNDEGALQRCAITIDGDRTPTQGDMCEFTPHLEQTSKASLMYASFIDSVETFCDDDVADVDLRHDGMAPNTQNERCNGRSAWAVMRENPDFQPSVAPAPGVGTVTFRLIHQQPLRIAIIMDVSGSMDGDRLQTMKTSVIDFLNVLVNSSNISQQEIYVSLVEFSTDAAGLHQLAIINDANLADYVLEVERLTAGGSTAIGKGILEGIDQIVQAGVGTEGSLLVVFSDGDENEPPYIAQVQPDVCTSKAQVFSILVDSVAVDHPLVGISNDTCGDYCIFDDQGVTTMYDCLLKALGLKDPSLLPQQVHSSNLTVASRNSTSEQVIVESSLSSHVRFGFSWLAGIANQCQNMDVTLTNPAGGVIDRTNTNNYTKKETSISIVAGSDQGGRWTYVITNPSSANCNVRMKVEAFSSGGSSGSDSTIHISTKLSATHLNVNTSISTENYIAFYADLKKGTTPITDAEIKATVINQQVNMTYTYIVYLKDDGTGADFRAKDGIYSLYFNDFLYFGQGGIYNVRIDALGIQGRTMLHMEERSYGSGAPPLPQYKVSKTSTYEPAEEFQRNVDAGQFQVARPFAPLPPPSSPSGGLSAGAIAGIAVASVIVAVGASVGVVLVVREQMRKKKQVDVSPTVTTA